MSTRFARIVTGVGGLQLVKIESPVAEGEMYFHGGQVMSWKPAGADEVIFVSRQARWEPGRAIRGGAPICFPWFGAHPSDARAPAHGCVRIKAWQLDAITETDGVVTVSMSTGSDDETRRWWPSSFRLEHRATFGSTLTLELIVTNTGAEAFSFEEALHTYYRVGRIDDVRIRGLEGTRYLDAIDARREKAQEGEVVFTSETDRVYLDTSSPIVIADGTTRRVRVTAKRSQTTVVWNPWVGKARALEDLADEEWPLFVCVETCNVSPRATELGAGEQHVMRVDVAVESGSGHDRDSP